MIGSYICHALLEKNYEIRALKRSDSDLSLVKDIQDQIEWVNGDILDILLLKKAIEGAEWVIHCAAYISYDSRDEDTMFKINVEGTANVVNACLETGVNQLFHVSSVAAIEKEKYSKVVDENGKGLNLEEGTSYARSKYLSELEVWRGTVEGLKAIIINPSLVIGPGDWTKSSTRIFKYIWDEKRFYTNGVVNFVDVRDVSAVAVQLLESNYFGQRFIVSAGNVTYKRLFDKIAVAFGKRAPDLKVEGLLIKLAIWADKLRVQLRGGKPLITNELEQVSKNKHVFDSTKVQSTLGYSFRELDETVDWCCQQLLKNS